MNVTTKFRANVGIRELIVAETPLYCVIHYVKTTNGSPTNPGLVNEFCLNVLEKKLYQFNGMIWNNISINTTDRFLFCKDGLRANGCGNNIADQTIYYKCGIIYENKYATDGIVVLIKNTSLGFKANSLIAYNGSDNTWIVNEASDVNSINNNDTTWLNPVISKTLMTPPASPNVGDRYIIPSGANGNWAGQDNNIAEWNSWCWEFTNHQKGFVLYVNDENKIYACDGIIWAELSSGVTDHSLLSNIQGGAPSEYYHLSNSEYLSMTGNKSNNLILASPDTISGTPNFRSIVDNDLPPIDGGGF